MKKIVVMLIVGLLVFSMFMNVRRVMSALENTEIYIDAVDIQPDGSFERRPMRDVKVNITRTETGASQYSYTNGLGYVAFFVNSTGPYLLNCSYAGYAFTPKIITITVGISNSFHDVIIKTGIFSLYTQLVQVREFFLVDPAVVLIRFPSSPDVNITLESFSLRAEIDKGPDHVSIVPKDVSETPLVENGTIFYPNYTLTMQFTPMEYGRISLIATSEGKIVLNQDPVCYVAQGMLCNVTLTIHVARPPASKAIEDVTVKIDEILLWLRTIDSLGRMTLANVTKWDKVFVDFVNARFGNDSLPTVMSRLLGLRSTVDLFRTDFYDFKSSFSGQVYSVVTTFFVDLRNLVYLFGVIAGVFIFAVILQIISKRGKTKKIVVREGFKGVG